MVNKNDEITYREALTDKEILEFGLILDKFKNNKISYNRLEDKFLERGVLVEPVVKDFSNRSMSIDDVNALDNKMENKKFRYSDIDYYLLSSEDYSDIKFNIDLYVCRVLSDYGITEYQRTMAYVLSHSITSDNSVVYNNKIKREIREIYNSLERKKFVR